MCWKRINTTIGDVVTPALEVLTQPIAASRRLAQTIGALVALREENARLRDENRRLLDWQSAAASSRSRTRPCARCSTTAPTPSGRPRSPAA